jgi:hypothetical protein
LPGEVEPVIAIRVSSLSDLARLASTMASRLIVMPIYRFKHNGNVYYMIQASFKDYYKLYGLPIVYYYKRPLEEDVSDEDAKYVLVKADMTGEVVELTPYAKTGFVVVPIVNLDGKPPHLPDDI